MMISSAMAVGITSAKIVELNIRVVPTRLTTMLTMKHDPKRESGFEDDTDKWFKVCLNPSHEPPGHMVIPAGKVYRHVCPGCGYQVVIRPPMIHW